MNNPESLEGEKREKRPGSIYSLISTEQGFLKASTIGLGIPAAAIGGWGIAGYGTAAVLLVIPISFVGAYAWGFVMWRLMFRDLYEHKDAER